MIAFQEKIPPTNAMMASRCLGVSEKVALKAHVEAILRSINVALSRIAGRNAAHPSLELASMEQNYTALRSQASGVLAALNTDGHSLNELLFSAVFLLDAGLAQNMSEMNQLGMQQQPSNTARATQLKQEIAEHPFMIVLTERRDGLTELASINCAMKADIKAVEEEGFKDLEKAIQVGGVVAQTGETSSADTVVSEADKEARKEEVVARAAESENELSRHKRIAQAIRMRAHNIHDAAIHIGFGMRKDFKTGNEQVLNAFQKFVVEPVHASLEKHPDYCNLAHAYLGKNARAWPEEMKAADDRLRAHLNAKRKSLSEMTMPIAKMALKPDYFKVYGDWLHQSRDDIGAESARLTGLLDNQASTISREKTRVQSAIVNLAGTLEGKHTLTSNTTDVLQEIAGIKPADVEKDILAFHERHGMLKPMVDGVNAKWKKIRQAFTDAKGNQTDAAENIV